MDELDILIQEFEIRLKEKDKVNKQKKEKNSLRNAYLPRIRDYFIPFIREDFISYQSDYIGREKIYFESIFNRESIIKATIYYVLNSMTKGIEHGVKKKKISSISDFLSSFNSFFELVLNDRYHMNMSSCMPFQEKLANEIKERLVQMGYDLQETKNNPAIRKIEYDFILDYFQNIVNKISDKQLQVFIIFQLSLLYGLSNKTIVDIKVNDIDLERRTLKIVSKNKLEHIILELPYKIFCEIRNHIENNRLVKEELLFYKESKDEKNVIDSSFYTDIIDNIQSEFSLKFGCENLESDRFTQYGMVKYAIGNMLDENINVKAIEQVTGRDIKFIMSCTPDSKSTTIEFNNYVNAKLRNTSTYKDCN